ncbi:hypothetical protein Tco_0946158 [Tanacetum coccineum]
MERLYIAFKDVVSSGLTSGAKIGDSDFKLFNLFTRMMSIARALPEGVCPVSTTLWVHRLVDWHEGFSLAEVPQGLSPLIHVSMPSSVDRWSGGGTWQIMSVRGTGCGRWSGGGPPIPELDPPVDPGVAGQYEVVAVQSEHDTWHLACVSPRRRVSVQGQSA